ncbi:amino acid permease aap11ld-like protein [Angomonas deanei]|uniref:Transmembrane amino acid transporter protein, putative n=1 Tax=Angomonas deanei TaxID=59799 RepID=S9VKQ7_9TRYP|nr:amino acid permease aap11ld-like protein [Angomonas deanei]EPY43387.1 amino acid permease aap11ld-like protein [Angomonas deanei]CAD2213317.1 Transmembrane amino acid transporter protein, putative [Angomonas deanei]|eukprot:EPY30003.1 amino acid permease aap11ld-like protein [Angomonas deanei]
METEKEPLLPDHPKKDERVKLPPPQYNTDDFDWKQNNNNSIFFDNRTFSSLDEMKGSLLEMCCSGDGILSGALSLITTAATPTMLAIPLAFAVGGWTFAISCTLFCILITFLSVRILALASISADSDDYETVAGFFLGSAGKWTARCVLLFYNFGCSIVYLSFIKDSITPILIGRATFLPESLRNSTGGSLFLLLSTAVIAPLTFNSRLASLRTKGFISNVFTIFIIFAIAYRYFNPAETALSSENTPDPVATSLFTNPKILVLLPYLFVAPIFVFSYEVQSNVMAVIKDLQDRTGKKILMSITLALVTVTMFYVLLGVFGSLTFPNLREGNILSRYDVQKDNLMMTCQVLCCFSASISFVFCLFPCRQAVFMYLSDGKTPKIPKKMRVRIGTCLTLVAAVLAIFLPDVAQVVSVLGALFSATLSMTFPALFAMKMRAGHSYLTGYVDAVISYVLLFIGISFSVVGVIMSFVFGG